ncbi:MAG: hypothetical protein HOI95_07330 [Chromatiales bacterium]|jgi:hypothetical protein|nr:hypothetical protein [Chromatiales bacterium]
MPLEVFSAIEEVPELTRIVELAASARALRASMARWSRLLPPLELRGVHGYRTIAEAGAARDAAEVRRARALALQRDEEAVRE